MPPKITRKWLLATGIALAGCGAAPPVPDARDAAWARTQWPDATVAQLDQGRSLFVARCASCHELPDPGDRPPSTWPVVLGEMAPRARLTDPEVAAVTRYLSAASDRIRGGR